MQSSQAPVNATDAQVLGQMVFQLISTLPSASVRAPSPSFPAEAYFIQALYVSYLFLHHQRKLIWQLRIRSTASSGSRCEGHARSVVLVLRSSAAAHAVAASLPAQSSRSLQTAGLCASPVDCSSEVRSKLGACGARRLLRQRDAKRRGLLLGPCGAVSFDRRGG